MAKLPYAELTCVEISQEEHREGKPSLESIQTALGALHRDGMVVLTNAILHEHLDKVKEQFWPDTDTVLSWEGAHFNQGDNTRNLSQVPPLRTDLIYQDIYANQFATPIISAYLGPKPELRFARSAVLLPGGERQMIHADLEYPYPDHPFAVAVNMGLEDITEENGATELMLGTHNMSSIDKHMARDQPNIKPELVAEAVKTHPVIRPPLPKGALAIRDLRMWHSGVPNNSGRRRPMLGFIWMAHWYDGYIRITLPKTAKNVIESWSNYNDINIVAEYVDEPLDYLQLPFEGLFESRKVKEQREADMKAAGITREKWNGDGRDRFGRLINGKNSDVKVAG